MDDSPSGLPRTAAAAAATRRGLGREFGAAVVLRFDIADGGEAALLWVMVPRLRSAGHRLVSAGGRMDASILVYGRSFSR